MSIFELVDYDRLLDRIGVPHGKIQTTVVVDGVPKIVTKDLEWFCGDNPPQNYSYDEVGITYNDTLDYNGRSQHNPGGLCLTADINVNGLTLNTRDQNGTMWLCTGVEGWWSLPPSEIPDVPKPYWDGSMVTTGRYQSRVITITGCFVPPGPEWVWYNRDAILRCCSAVRGVGLLAMCGNQSPTNTEMLFTPPVDSLSKYTYETQVTAPPGSGAFRTSAVSPSATTTIWVHYKNAVGEDHRSQWTGTTIGSEIFAQDIDNPAASALYTLTANPVDNGDYITLSVAHVSSNALMTGDCQLGVRTPALPPVLNPFYDPAKMAIIQTADTPLIDTIRPNGFTQFSLSFKCAYATKEAIKEKNKVIPVPKTEKAVGRSYKSFSLKESALPPDNPASGDTSYTELQQILGDPLKFRKYSDVEFYNPDSLIPDENSSYAYVEGTRIEDWIFHNSGNYFAFPTIVLEEVRGINLTLNRILQINNDTTDDTMTLVKNIPAEHWLVVDSLARRVSLVPPNLKNRPGNWLWNARDYLALDSEWISLAAGDNQFYIQKGQGVVVPYNVPTMYWRDSWIG